MTFISAASETSQPVAEERYIQSRGQQWVADLMGLDVTGPVESVTGAFTE